MGEWLAAAADEDLNDVELANLREMTRHYQQATILPESLVEAKSLAGSRCEHAWRTQRPANDWQGFSANLKEVVKLSREEARLRAEAKGCTPYDALLDIFEPDMTSARPDVLFGDLKSGYRSCWQRLWKNRLNDRSFRHRVPSRPPRSASWAGSDENAWLRF